MSRVEQYSAMAPTHVVVISLPVHGHVNPLLQLSAKLASLGVTVSMITTQTVLRKVPEMLHSIVECQEQEDAVDRNLKFMGLFDGDHREELQVGGTEGIWANFFFMYQKAEEISKMIEQAASEHGPVCGFIVDMLAFGSVEKITSKRPDIPTVIFWTAPVSFLLLTVHLPSLIERGYLPLKPGSEENKFTIPGVPELSLGKDLPYVYQEDTKYDPGHQHSSKIRGFLLQFPYILVNTFEELEEEAIHAMQREGIKLLSIGPLLPMSSPNKPLPVFDPVFNWLSSKPTASVVYVCFGTMSSMSCSEQVEELAYGLEQSGHPFLWILREEFHILLPHKFQVKQTHQFMISPWCPQLQVLRHDSIGAFLTHCGWNSILEGLSSGVPMLGWPCLAEQNLNSKYLADVWGAGIRVHTQHKQQKQPVVDRNRVREAIQEVMSGKGEQMRKRAAEWRDAARRAVGDNGSSTKNIEEITQAFTPVP